MKSIRLIALPLALLLFFVGCGSPAKNVTTVSFLPELHSASELIPNEVPASPPESEPEFVPPLLNLKPLQSAIPYRAQAWRITDGIRQTQLKSVQKLDFPLVGTSTPSHVAEEIVVRSKSDLDALTAYQPLVLLENDQEVSFTGWAGRYDDSFFQDHDLLLFVLSTGYYKTFPMLGELAYNQTLCRYELPYLILSTSNTNVVTANWMIGLEVEKNFFGYGADEFPLLTPSDLSYSVSDQVFAKLEDGHVMERTPASITPVESSRSDSLPTSHTFQLQSIPATSLVAQTQKIGLFSHPFGEALLKSPEELADYTLCENVTLWPYVAPFDSISTESQAITSYEALAAQYDAAFFAKNDLHVFLCWEESAFYQSRLCRAGYDADTGYYELDFSRYARSVGYSSKACCWLFLTELPKGTLAERELRINFETLYLPYTISAILDTNGITLEKDWDPNHWVRNRFFPEYQSDQIGIRATYPTEWDQATALVAYYPDGFTRTQAATTKKMTTRSGRKVTVGFDKRGNWTWIDYHHSSGCYGAINTNLTGNDAETTLKYFLDVRLGLDHYTPMTPLSSVDSEITAVATSSAPHPNRISTETYQLLGLREHGKTGYAFTLAGRPMEELVMRSTDDFAKLLLPNLPVWPFHSPFNPVLDSLDPRTTILTYLEETFDETFFQTHDLYLTAVDFGYQPQAVSLYLDEKDETPKLQLDLYPGGEDAGIAKNPQYEPWILLVALEKGALSASSVEHTWNHVNYVSACSAMQNGRGVTIKYDQNFTATPILTAKKQVVHLEADTSVKYVEVGWWKDGFQRTKADHTKTKTAADGRSVTVGYNDGGNWLWVDYNHPSGCYGAHNHNVFEKNESEAFDAVLSATLGD